MEKASKELSQDSYYRYCAEIGTDSINMAPYWASQISESSEDASTGIWITVRRECKKYFVTAPKCMQECIYQHLILFFITRSVAFTI
jgi:hypothetical protein